MSVAARILTVMMCLALTLSGGAMAGHGPAVAGYAELCRDGAVAVVAVDASGQPVAPGPADAPHCPECLAPSILWPSVVPAGPPTHLCQSRGAVLTRDLAIPGRARFARLPSRAPPVAA